MSTTSSDRALSLNQFFAASEARVDRWRTLNRVARALTATGPGSAGTLRLDPKELLTESPTAAPVPKRTVAPAATLSDVALGSFAAAPPAGPETSIPTRMGAPVVFVQAKKVPRPPIRITPGTE